jgi:hypothetical protein
MEKRQVTVTPKIISQDTLYPKVANFVFVTTSNDVFYIDFCFVEPHSLIKKDKEKDEGRELEGFIVSRIAMSIIELNELKNKIEFILHEIRKGEEKK